MLKKLKKYIVGNDSETYAVSLVDEPAIEENFMYFKKEEGEKLEVTLESNEKHLVAGAVLVPDRPIYRNNGEEEFYVEFTKEAIEKMSQDFLKDFRQHNATVQHEEEAPEVYMVESWLKADMDRDKSVALGLNPNLPEGTWFAVFRVNNVDVWERIKSGELRGFSVESLISLEEVDFSKVEQPVELEEQAPEPQPEPIVEEPTPVVEESAPVVEEPVVEEAKTEEQNYNPLDDIIGEPKPNPLEDLIKSLQSEIESLKQTNAGLVDKVNDLSKQPSAKPISTAGASGGNGGDTFRNWREQMARYM